MKVYLVEGDGLETLVFSSRGAASSYLKSLGYRPYNDWKRNVGQFWYNESCIGEAYINVKSVLDGHKQTRAKKSL